ncbi:MAG: HAD superfamily hydrolase (TIGR01490 family) [Oceanicoccus sp.]
MNLAIFDLDNTLLSGDSDHAWGEFLVSNGIVDGDAYREKNDYFYQQYQQGGLDIVEFLEFALKPLSEHPKSQLDSWHNQFMSESISAMRLEKADQLLSKHRAEGDYLLIITATNSFVTGPIAKALGVDHIIATDPEFVNGAFTGKVSGTPCFQEGKVTRLNDWLVTSGHSLSGSYFYSDSHNDLPLLNLVDNPIVVDADNLLLIEAKKRDWPVISLR